MRRTYALLVVVALVPASCQKHADSSPEAQQATEIVATPSGAEMVLIPAGWFTMGSRTGQPDEAPPHTVWIDALVMDRYEVTQEQWDKLMLGNPSHFKGAKLPVEQISWAAAALYCNKRSEAEGLTPCYDEETAKCNFLADGYRLPTEAEWEYACRAGAPTEYAFGNDARQLGEHAWYAENSGNKTHPVGQKRPNAWGLHDMHGNVAEWCNDVYRADYYERSPQRNPTGPANGDQYVLRGGAWNSKPEACRAAHRVGEDPGFQDACFARDAVGFRCVRRAVACGCAPSARDAGKSGFVFSPVYLRHQTGAEHPECPQRLSAILERLEESGRIERLVRLEPRPAAEEWITAIHSPDYVQRLQESCRKGAGYIDSRDTPVSKDSYAAAVAAAGGVLAAIDAVMDGKVRNAFCAVRPPGHHALKDRAMGFCLLNNVAIGARYAQKKHKLARVLIVDWDVHHGNGTQAAFYDDPTVLYFSIHRDRFYPGTGSAAEKGEGGGLGFTVNVPMAAGAGDAEYLAAFAKSLAPAAAAFRPDFVLVSAGFDAHQRDPLGGMKLTSTAYAEMTRVVKKIAADHCHGRMVSVLEGGYDLEGLADAVEAHLSVMMREEGETRMMNDE